MWRSYHNRNIFGANSDEKAGGKNVRQADHSTKTKTPIAVDYSGIGNTSGNLQNGGDQAYVQGRGVVIDNRDDSGSQMLCFDDSTQNYNFIVINAPAYIMGQIALQISN